MRCARVCRLCQLAATITPSTRVHKSFTFAVTDQIAATASLHNHKWPHFAAAAAAAAVTASGTESHMHCVSDSTATMCEGHMGVIAHCATGPVAVTALHMPPGMDKKNKALAQRPCTIWADITRNINSITVLSTHRTASMFSPSICPRTVLGGTHCSGLLGCPCCSAQFGSHQRTDSTGPCKPFLHVQMPSCNQPLCRYNLFHQ